MPKIVDHDKKRQEVALKSAEVFLTFGYKNIGMRQLCDALGMSKSAVYHYYKSKDELFIAATQAILTLDAQILKACPLATHASREQKIENFLRIFNQIAPRFRKEMILVSDYMSVIGEENIASDPCMLIANQNYLKILETYVSLEHREALYTLILGLLTHQMLLGKQLDKTYIQTQVNTILR